MQTNFELNDQTPLIQMDFGDLKKLLLEILSGRVEQMSGPREYLYGLRGIEKEFKVGHNTAQKLKDGILKDAILQSAPGHKIVVDAELARELYKKSKEDWR